MEIRKQKGKQVEKLTVTEQIDQKHQEDLQRLRGFRLLDDDFFTKCFEGDMARACLKIAFRQMCVRCASAKRRCSGPYI